MARIMEITDEIGKLHQIASACQRDRPEKANGTRINHREMTNMMSGGITAPVARTTPNSTMDVPKKRNDQTTMALRCADTANAAPLAGKNRLRALLLNTWTIVTRAPTIKKLNNTPVPATLPTRSHFSAPTFCAAIEEAAAPMASAGICT